MGVVPTHLSSRDIRDTWVLIHTSMSALTASNEKPTAQVPRLQWNYQDVLADVLVSLSVNIRAQILNVVVNMG